MCQLYNLGGKFQTATYLPIILLHLNTCYYTFMLLVFKICLHIVMATRYQLLLLLLLLQVAVFPTTEKKCKGWSTQINKFIFTTVY